LKIKSLGITAGSFNPTMG